MALLDVISRDELQRLTRTSNARALAVTVGNFVLIAAGFALPALWHHPLAWVLGAIVLGGRALGLGILVHDTAHLTFFESRRLNEWAGRWLFGSLPNVPYQAYRKGHLDHHRNAGTQTDPDLAFVAGYPASGASLARKFLRDLSGLNGLKNIGYQLLSFRPRAQAPFIVAHALLFGLLYALGVPQVYLCWWLGQLFVFPMVLRLRVMGEHGAVPDHFASDPRLNTGTTLAGPLARLLISPNWVNFHVEHHLAAAVPSYRLAEMHGMLKQRGYYRDASCIMPSYLGVLRRCLRTTPGAKHQLAAHRARGSLSNMQ